MNSFEKMVAPDSITVLEAMKQINDNSQGILFLVNSQEVLQGCITDGDIRRFIIGGGDLTNNVLVAANRTPKTAKNDYDASILLKNNDDHFYVPILDDNHRIIGLYNGNNSTQKHIALRIPIVINAGGIGTRLNPFTKVLPKPLIPIGDYPIIEHIMREFQSYECNDFHVIVNYKKELIKAFFNGSERKYNIRWYDEKKPLGTGGGLSLLQGLISQPFVFSNCDTLLMSDYAQIYDFHKKNQNVITMICANKKLNVPYGVVKLNEDNTISNIEEKPTYSFLTNTGVYIVEPEVIDDVDGNEPIGFPDVIEIERKKGKRVAVFSIDEDDWMDMGQIPELQKMYKKLYGEQ